MSIVKLPFIVSGVVAIHVTGTPPNPPHPLSEHIIPDWREKFLKSLALPSRLLRTLFWITGIVEIAVIIASQNTSGSISRRVLSALVLNIGSAANIRITPLSILGSVLTFFGTALRVKAYRTLGTLFTFELCIQKHHKLVTEGPYAFIRHPSYTGLISTLVGVIFSQAAQGSWLRECGMLHTPLGQGLALFWVMFAGAVIVSLILRLPKEDDVLRGRFGNEWVEWAQRVPYSLVPGVY